MQKPGFFSLLCVLFATPFAAPAVQAVAAQEQAAVPAGRPVDYAAFKARYQQYSTTPAGAVRLYFDAVYSYIDPARRAEGAKMLRYSLHERKEWEQSAALNTFVSRLRNPAYHYIFRSFAAGTSPENNYAMDPDNYQLMLVKVLPQTDYVLVTLRSSGADSPRPLHVRQFDDGLWYVVNQHGSYADVRKPVSVRQSEQNSHDADFD